tara:strand:- start:122 stop:307 length:186 start_codon:yes stop_codon:yes gene_type:complete
MHGGSVHGSVKADIFMILEVRIGAILQEGLDHREILSLNRKMERRLAIDIPRVDVYLIVVQ